MIDIKASAPGKVIVAGEFAVLDGAPAICMAVNRRAHVSITGSTENYHTVSAPGFSDDLDSFALIGDSAEKYPLLAAVWQELQTSTSDYLNVVLDSSGFRDSEAGKIGIGSSAALTVALTAALYCLRGESRLAGENPDIRDTAMAAHRRLQGGAGSGADIACSMAGGIIEYRMSETTNAGLDWPVDLHYAVLWSGTPADTRAQLAKFDSAERHESRAELGGSARLVAGAWKDGDLEQVMSSLSEYIATLRRFDLDHMLGIFDAGHAALADTADSQGVVYKPCGAGGGDLGIAISRDESDLAVFVDSARQQGFKLMDLSIDVSGVIVDGNN